MIGREDIAPRRAAAPKRFWRDEDGAILVEFALVLPFMLLVFVLSIESARLMLSYQSAVSGVRDAGRYLARVAPGDICATGGSVGGYATQLKNIVENSIGGNSVFPAAVTVNTVTPTLSCITGSYRNGTVPVATVTANLTIDFPLRAVLSLFGGGLSTAISASVTDQARIFGQ